MPIEMLDEVLRWDLHSFQRFDAIRRRFSKAFEPGILFAIADELPGYFKLKPDYS